MSGLTGLPVKAEHSNAVLMGESSGVKVVDNQSTGKGGIVDLALTFATQASLRGSEIDDETGNRPVIHPRGCFRKDCLAAAYRSF